MKSSGKFIWKNYFFKIFKFLLILLIDIFTPVISSTQIAFEVMCVQHVIFTYSTERKTIFFYKELFL